MKLKLWKPESNTFAIPLFVGLGQWLGFAILLLGIFALSLSWEYHQFLAFKQSGYKENISSVNAVVLNQYEKTSAKGTYSVLKLKMPNGTIFYTTTKDKIKNLMHRELRLNLINTKIKFWDYLRGFYALSITIELLPATIGVKEQLRDFITKQHENALIAGFYQTLFLADTLPITWRNTINALGITHLMAISGFHYGILSLCVLLLVYLPYSALHRRFFPYRNAFYDIGFFTLLCGGFYLLLLQNSPSFLRAFTMALWAYFLAFCGMKVFSLLSLALLVALLLALFPPLIFSLSLLFSVSGVFYIFLFLHHYGAHGIIKILCLQCGIFLFMLPLTHFFFTPFSPLSVLSVPLTLAFAVFYPVVLVLHALGIGGLFDAWLLWFAALKLPTIAVSTPPILFVLWILLSLLAIAHKRFFVLLNLFCCAIFLWNLALFWFK